MGLIKRTILASVLTAETALLAGACWLVWPETIWRDGDGPPPDIFTVALFPTGDAFPLYDGAGTPAERELPRAVLASLGELKSPMIAAYVGNDGAFFVNVADACFVRDEPSMTALSRAATDVYRTNEEFMWRGVRVRTRALSPTTTRVSARLRARAGYEVMTYDVASDGIFTPRRLERVSPLQSITIALGATPLVLTGVGLLMYPAWSRRRRAASRHAD